MKRLERRKGTMLSLNQRVWCNGNSGVITRLCDGQLTGMVEVRLPGGEVCVSASEVQPVDGYHVGAILDSSWGYEQTNSDFYRIERRKNDTVWLLPLRSISRHVTDMTGTCIPGEPKQPGDFEPASQGCRWDGKLIRRTLKRYKEGRIAGLSIKHGWASLWEGTPQGWTGYA